MTEFQDKHISVIGAARSGMDAARILAQLGANVLLSDSKPTAQLGVGHVAQLEALDAPFVLGADVETALPPATELVVTSPGVPRTAPVLQAAIARKLPVWSEIELAFRLTDAPIIAVTGTNGKTTTTLLIAHILQKAGMNALVAGNISADAVKRTLVNAAWETRGEGKSGGEGEKESRGVGEIIHNPQSTIHNPQSSIIVAEISSFQLEWVETFAPQVAVLTNITPDHLNRHADFDEYAQTKARIFAAQQPGDWAILNNDNPAARAIGSALLQADAARQLVWFTHKDAPPNGKQGEAWVQDGFLTVRLGSGCAVALLRADELPPTLPGAHSIENVLAAATAALAFHVPPEIIAQAVRAFPGVPHRMEFVRELNGVRYINNSMCTNVEAAIRSLRAVSGQAVAIMGGADKELEYAPLVPALREKAKHVVLIGQVADKMETTFRAGGYAQISRAASLEYAVTQARVIAAEGETILLLPACASFDMFRDFEARGVAFREIVHALPSETQPSQFAAETTNR